MFQEQDVFENEKIRIPKHGLPQAGTTHSSICDKNIVELASGGLALQGVYQTGDVDDLFKDRQKLIKIANYKILNPQHASELQLYEFASHESQQKHEATIKQIGFKFSIPKGPCGSIICESSSQNQSLSKSQSILLTMCSYIPFASVHIDEDQILLSESALEKLKEISALLPASGSDKSSKDPLILLELADNFFEKFGSHATQGPFHFGGTFWKKACSELGPDRDAQMNTVKSVVKAKLESSFLTCQVQNSKATTCEQEDIEVKMSVVMVGGPPGEDDYSKWRNGLCEGNWAVIDRGNCLIPVWKIIKLNHRNDFSNYNKLCQFLKEAYEKITKQIPKPEIEEKILDVVSEAKQMMESVKNWSTLGDAAEKHLIELLNMRRKIKSITLSFHAWTDICLSDELLQQFLMKVTLTQNATPLKQLMMSVIDTESSLIAFPRRDAILRWAQNKKEAECVKGTIGNKPNEQFKESDETPLNCPYEPDYNNSYEVGKTEKDISENVFLKTENCAGELEVSNENETSQTFKKLITKLGFQTTSKKLSFEDFVIISRLSLNTRPETEEIEMWSHYIYKLTSLDSSVRCLRSTSISSKHDSSEPSKKEYPNSSETSGDDFYNFGEYSEDQCKDEDKNIHPMDLQMAVFACCDPFAQLYICRQLSLFQFALPLLVPNPRNRKEIQCPLWALKQIEKTLYSKESKGNYKIQNVLNSSIPVVSFIRLGESSVSKSQLMNSIISNKCHPVFFNRDMKNSTRNRILLEGVAEIFWFCPSDKEDDTFQKNMAFINLHGDMRGHPKQLTFIKDVSSAIVLLLPEDKLDKEAKLTVDELRNSPTPIITLFTGVEGTADKTRIGAKNKTKAELAEVVISRICENLASPKTQSLEDYCEEQVKNKHLILRSEKEIQKWQDKGQQLFKRLTSCFDVLQLKSKCLPLQGEYWANWCIKDKQFFRPQGKKIKTREQEKDEITQEKQTIRKTQCATASCSEYTFLPEFLEHLIKMQPGVKYMLNWLEKTLAEHFSGVIDGLKNKYHALWMTANVYGEYKEEVHAELDKIRKGINSAFGLKHIMREVAQLYEAFFSEKKVECHGLKIDTFPEVGADMLLSGYPLEIIDGDVNHVPLLWVNAVIDMTIKKIGDKKVFVLSVLGPQSSGKSTLLNAMFGLRFEVSPGCCTRGACMQLLKVEENIRQQLQFDYLLVLDTEGLGSPEKIHNPRQHDNELATFVTGIGDLTLINIMGENPSVMKEPLQICFQAFLRMKLVNLKPSCIFVHQNVCEATAKEKNSEGRRKFFEELNTISQLAAKEENQKVTGFNEIIHIDFDTQVFYFKNYLEGTPPMAPPNPSYSQNVQELKDQILSIAKWRPGFKASKMSEFKIRVNDLWNALLKENFIFHFQNSLAVSVYKRLEQKYMEWSWCLRKHALETHNKLYNLLMADVGQLEKYEDTEMNDILQELHQQLSTFFEEDDHSDILEQWRLSIIRRLECLKDELMAETKTRKVKLVEQSQYIKRMDKRKAQLIADFSERSKKLASVLKEPDDKKMKIEFNNIWSEWTDKVARENPRVDKIGVHRIIEKALEERFRCFRSDTRDCQHEQNFTFQPDKHICVGTEGNMQSHGVALSQQIEKDCHALVSESNVHLIGVSENLICAILNKISQIIKDDNQGDKFSPDYKADISAHVLHKEACHLTELQDQFEKRSGLDFSTQKEDYFRRFKLTCHGAVSVKLFVDYLMNHIQSAVKDAITKKATIEMVNKIKATCPAFHSTRSNLEAHIMKHLAIEENFDEFVTFIQRPRQYFHTFISNSIDAYFLKDDKVSQICKTNLSLLKAEILTKGLHVTSVIKERGDSTSKWLDEFCTELCYELPLSREIFKNIEDIDLSDTDELKTTFAESLNEMQKNEEYFYEKLPKYVMDQLCVKSSEILLQQFSGCWERCPFCHTVCTNSIPNHEGDHTAQWHRCKGLGHCYTTDQWNVFSASKQFTIEFCTTSVNSSDTFQPPKSKKSFPFKDYRRAGHPYDKWSIKENDEPKDYWKWFICRFKKELKSEYSFKFQGHGKIPQGWRSIQKSDILKELGI